MNSIVKIALAVAVASFTLAATAGDSMARGKRKAAAAPAACAPWSYKTTVCGQNVCNMARCGYDRTWRPSLAVCWKPWCPGQRT